MSGGAFRTRKRARWAPVMAHMQRREYVVLEGPCAECGQADCYLVGLEGNAFPDGARWVWKKCGAVYRDVD
jgi:hypothetical protein